MADLSSTKPWQIHDPAPSPASRAKKIARMGYLEMNWLTDRIEVALLAEISRFESVKESCAEEAAEPER